MRVTNTKRYLSKDGAKVARVLPRGSVLISCIGNLGKVGFAERELATNQQINSIIFNKDVIPDYGFYYCQTLKNWLEENSSNTTIAIVNKGRLEKAPFIKTSIENQQKVVDKLNNTLPQVNGTIEKVQRAKVLLQKFRQAVLSAAVTGRLTEEWREKNTQQEWKSVSVKEVALDIDYGYTASSTQNKSGPKFLRITDIQDNNVNWDTVPYCVIEKSKIKKYLLYKGDIVFARTGATTGKSFLLETLPEAIFASYLIRVRPNTEKILPEYLYCFFHSSNYWGQITDNLSGSAQPSCNATKLSSLQLDLPSLDEQKEIVLRVNSLLKISDVVEKQTEVTITRVDKLTQSILSKAFRGELTS